MGLIGNGGVHAIDKHLFALIDLCAERKVPRVAIHALLDGRDTMPRSGARLHAAAARATRKGRAVVASLGGRYFGMDRDKRWDRTEKWYRVAVRGRRTRRARDPLEVIRAAYERNETDEFITPDGHRATTASRSRRCATATRSSASTIARTACGRSSAR